jgi:hypothetical protein
MNKFGWLPFILLFSGIMASGQPTILRGQVKDAHNEEAIPFASVVLKPVQRGAVTDSLGFFNIEILPGWQADSLEITYVGYDKFTISTKEFPDSGYLKIILQRAVTQGVVVKTKADRGLILWRKVLRNKPRNDRSRFPYFAYELHNKLELDFNKINKEKLEKTVEERTEELVQKNIVVEQQKHLVEEKHKEITDSINYAKRLQHAIFPPTDFITTNFPTIFLLPAITFT